MAPRALLLLPAVLRPWGWGAAEEVPRPPPPRDPTSGNSCVVCVAQRDRLTPPGRACLPLPVMALQPSEVRSSRVGVQARGELPFPTRDPTLPCSRAVSWSCGGSGVHPADLEAEGLASATPRLLGSQIWEYGLGVSNNSLDHRFKKLIKPFTPVGLTENYKV